VDAEGDYHRQVHREIVQTPVDRFHRPDLLPLTSRIHTRPILEYASREELRKVSHHIMKKAGNLNLLAASIKDTLIDLAAGNYRTLMMFAGKRLMAACERDITQIEEKVYFEFRNTRAPKLSA